MAISSAALRRCEPADDDSASVSSGVATELPPRVLEMLTLLNQTFDAHQTAAEGH